MNMPDQRTKGAGMAGGSLLALSIVGGVVAGTTWGQPSIGFLAGLGTGILLFILVWMRGRRG